jgi:hypothetical protein
MMCEDFHCCGLSAEEEVNCLPEDKSLCRRGGKLSTRRQISLHSQPPTYYNRLKPSDASDLPRCCTPRSHHEIAGMLPQFQPMTVFIGVLLSSNVDEFDVVCILSSNAGNVYYRIVSEVMCVHSNSL